MKHNVPTPLLTREEVAEQLKISTITVDRLRRNRELDCVKLGRSVRITQQSVTAYLARKAVRA
jgi:excisionase family DNA binding protein